VIPRWLLLACVGCGEVVAAPTPEATLTLAPVCNANALDVSLTVPLPGRPVFRIDDEVMGTSGVATRITDATAKDARGALPLVRRVRDGVLELVPSRTVSGPITLAYRARSVAAADKGAVEGLRHDETGIGGHGRHFIVLPDSQRRFELHVRWATTKCPGTGASTFEDVTGDLATLREAVYYWGTPQRTSTDDGTLHLRTAWFGKPAFDVAAAGAWAAKIFAAERAFFGDDDPTPCSIFVRVLASHEDRANGIGQETSYLSWIGPRTTFARRLEVNIAHEMLHRWLGLRMRLRGAEGSAYWFSEGFTVHYSNLIAFRAGLLTTEEFLESINDIATRHFDNKHAHATNDEIRRDFVRDPAVSIVPYTRGALYAAELDAALQASGKRRLDDVLRELYREARKGDGTRPADTVRRRVQAELGRAGVARYDAVIVRGEHPQPPANAYGPCFTQVARKGGGFTWARVPDVPDARCR
jgi:M61 glycyl aminopeptidase